MTLPCKSLFKSVPSAVFNAARSSSDTLYAFGVPTEVEEVSAIEKDPAGSKLTCAFVRSIVLSSGRVTPGKAKANAASSVILTEYGFVGLDLRGEFRYH